MDKIIPYLKSAIALPGYNLMLEFEDGVSGVVDLSNWKGKGVFEYYQFMRMQEAARLLKEKRLTVSEVGYQLGFTNLSHFSRVFEQHTGMKPKKYSATQAQLIETVTP